MLKHRKPKQMAGYKQEFNSQPNDKIDAELFNNEYGLLNTAFNDKIGHTHNGTEGEGAYISFISNLDKTSEVKVFDDKIVIINNSTDTLFIYPNAMLPGTNDLINLGEYETRFRDLHINGTANLSVLKVGSTDPNVIEDPSALLSINNISNNIELIENSETALATQYSIKTYIDNSISDSLGIFGSRSEYVVRDSEQQATGALAPYITMLIEDIKPGSKIHISATISALAMAIPGEKAGNIKCIITRDDTPLMSKELFVLSTTDTNNPVGGTVSMVFRDDGVTLSEHTYRLEFKEELVALGIGKAISGNMLILEELLRVGG